MFNKESKEEQDSSFNQKSLFNISDSAISEVINAMKETGINPMHFIDLFSISKPAKVFSGYRYLIFQALFEKYRSEADVGTFNPEQAEYASMLYELFYQTEEEFLQHEAQKQRHLMLQQVLELLKEDFAFDDGALQKIRIKLSRA